LYRWVFADFSIRCSFSEQTLHLLLKSSFNFFIMNNHNHALFVLATTIIGILLFISLMVIWQTLGRFTPAIASKVVVTITAIIPFTRTQTPTPTATSTRTQTPTSTATPTQMPTSTATPTQTPLPTPTLDLASCTVIGCGLDKIVTPLAHDDFKLLLAHEPPLRRSCPKCPANEHLSKSELDTLLAPDSTTYARLLKIVLSQQAYPIAPGVVYIVFDNAHHVVIDLTASGQRLRNIVPPIPKPELRRKVHITPAYCMSPNSLVVTTADYYNLDGSNKTEPDRTIFFHQGRAALFETGGRFNLDVTTMPAYYNLETVSWGGGPIFIWGGEYNYNPKNEWFTEANLAHYQHTIWGKLTVAISQDRRYLFLTVSYGKTLAEHAENIINLGQKWGIKIDRAMRFDGSENTTMAIRLDNYMVSLLNLKEPLIVNCFAVERN